jgi:hypothetical protein
MTLAKIQPLTLIRFVTSVHLCKILPMDDVINDSGCSQHMFHDIRSFTQYRAQKGPRIELGDNRVIEAVGVGTAHFNFPGVGRIKLLNTLHVPNLGKNLVSPGQSTGNGAKYLLDGDEMIIYAKEGFVVPDGRIIARIPKGRDNLYRMDQWASEKSNSIITPICDGIPRQTIQKHSLFDDKKPLLALDKKDNSIDVSAEQDTGQPCHNTNDKSPCSDCDKSDRECALFAQRWSIVSAQTWHERLGHLSQRNMKLLETSCATGIRMTPGTKIDEPCEPCILGKMARGSFPLSSTKSSQPGELIFSDIKGPLPNIGINGDWRYFVTYIDHFTRFTKLYLLKRKSDQIIALKNYVATMFSKHQQPIKCIQSFQTDNAGEY